MPVGIAIGGSALIGGGAAVYAANKQSDAAQKGAAAQTQLGGNALDYQKQIDTRTQGQLEPYSDFGSTTLPALSRLLGLGHEGAASIQPTLESLPGYAFARDQGVKSVNNALGSKGLTGAQAKGIARFVTGLADSTYGDQVARLSTAANTGLSSITTGANTGLGTGTNVGNTATGIGSAIQGGLVGSANAAAGGAAGVANAANGAANGYLTSKLLGLYGNTAPATGLSPGGYRYGPLIADTGSMY